MMGGNGTMDSKIRDTSTSELTERLSRCFVDAEETREVFVAALESGDLFERLTPTRVNAIADTLLATLPNDSSSDAD